MNQILNVILLYIQKLLGIIDSHDLMTNFVFDIENKKGELVFNSKVNTISIEKEKIKFSVNKNNFFYN